MTPDDRDLISEAESIAALRPDPDRTLAAWLRAKAQSYTLDAEALDWVDLTDPAEHWGRTYRAVAVELHKCADEIGGRP